MTQSKSPAAGRALVEDENQNDDAPTKADSAQTCKITAPSSAFTHFLLAAIRCERARVALALNTIDAAGIGLRVGLIDPACAVAMIEEVMSLTIRSSMESAL